MSTNSAIPTPKITDGMTKAQKIALNKVHQKAVVVKSLAPEERVVFDECYLLQFEQPNGQTPKS